MSTPGLSQRNVPATAEEQPSAEQVVSPFSRFSTRPEQTGLYSPDNEHENCGMAAVATLRGEPGHDLSLIYI